MVCTISCVAKINQLVFFLADALNIATVTIFSAKHPTNNEFMYGQAFWLVICSTTVSSFVNVTLLVDLVQTRDFSKSGK
jgi:potassium channel subfamily K, other eukaryote